MKGPVLAHPNGAEAAGGLTHERDGVGWLALLSILAMATLAAFTLGGVVQMDLRVAGAAPVPHQPALAEVPQPAPPPPAAAKVPANIVTVRPHAAPPSRDDDTGTLAEDASAAGMTARTNRAPETDQ